MAKIKPIIVEQKKAVVSVAAGLLVVVAGVLIWTQLISPTPKVGKEDEPEFSDVVGDIQVTAAAHLNEGNAEEGLKYYDDQIEKYGDNEKRELLILKSNFARAAEMFDDAVAFAKEADAMSSDITTTRAVAQAYFAKGDKEQALIHYKKLFDLRQAEEGESDPYKLAEGREATLGSILKELE